MGRSLADFPPMPFPQQQWAHRIPNPCLQAEQYNVDEIATLVDEQRAIFNPDQAAAFDAVLESITVRASLRGSHPSSYWIVPEAKLRFK